MTFSLIKIKKKSISSANLPNKQATNRSEKESEQKMFLKERENKK